MSTTLAFVDAETTGLDSGLGHDDPNRDTMWELCVKVRDHRRPELDGRWVWQLNVDGTPVTPAAAAINRFHERYVLAPDVPAALMQCPDNAPAPTRETSSKEAVARTLYGLLNGAHWVGAVADFDTRFMLPFLHEFYGPGVSWASLPWHYHLADVENLAAGRLQLPPPWDSHELFRRLGVQPPDRQLRHTAGGDVDWAEAVYDAVFAPEAVNLYLGDGSRLVAHGRTDETADAGPLDSVPA